MKKVDVMRFIFFISFGVSIYFYMGYAVAAQISSSLGISLNNSYLLWNAINALENPWYKEEFGPRKEEDPLSVALLTPAKENQLRSLVAKYDDLNGLVEGLIQARKIGDIDGFMKHKEQIAKKLRPIWQDAIYKERKKERERKSKEGWIAWIRNNITSAAHRFYQYFFQEARKK